LGAVSGAAGAAYQEYGGKSENADARRFGGFGGVVFRGERAGVKGVGEDVDAFAGVVVDFEVVGVFEVGKREVEDGGGVGGIEVAEVEAVEKDFDVTGGVGVEAGVGDGEGWRSGGVFVFTVVDEFTVGIGLGVGAVFAVDGEGVGPDDGG